MSRNKVSNRSMHIYGQMNFSINGYKKFIMHIGENMFQLLTILKKISSRLKIKNRILNRK